MKIFFFFLLFLPTAPRNRKKLPLPRKKCLFFRNSEEKVLKNPFLIIFSGKFKRASEKVSFFTNYVFSAVITRTHTHTLFYGPIMRKNRA